MRVAAVVAHPDDEVLGVGATLARHVHAGDGVAVLVVADGAGSRYPAHMRTHLQGSAEKAALELGVGTVQFGGLPDQRLDQLPLLEVSTLVGAFLDKVRPQVVYSHFPGDVNLDHAVVARATWTTCRPYERPGVREFLVFETPSSTEWRWPGIGEAFSPAVFVDVTKTLPVKLAAMACYESELRPPPHPRDLEALAGRAAYWGSHVGVAAAEPFMLLRSLR